jgi:hypothetical protein
MFEKKFFVMSERVWCTGNGDLVKMFSEGSKNPGGSPKWTKEGRTEYVLIKKEKEKRFSIVARANNVNI